MLDTLQLEPFAKLDKDLKVAALTLTPNEARYLVDAYYAIQGYRIRFGNQIRALAEDGEPHELIRWMHGNTEGLEKNVQKALDAYSKSHIVGEWARSIPGIGPVIASGLLAHIDITKAPTAGHIWSYAGVVPGQAWEKGQKRPWNASLKRLLFLLGESFIKVQNRPNDIYGKIYAERKRLEQEANDYLFYADQAASILQSKRIGKDTDAYKAYVQGKLPPAHIHARARRYASKLFLAHLQHVMWEVEYKEAPARPYVMEHLGHIHIIRPPRWPIEGGQAPVHEDEIVQATPENWLEHAERTFPPRTPLYMTLEAQILQFKEAWHQLEQRALQHPKGEPETEIKDILEGFVPSAAAPNLSERLARYRATRKP